MALLNAKPVAAGYADTAGSLRRRRSARARAITGAEPVPVPVPTAAAMEATPQPIFTNPALSDSDAEGGAVGGIKRAEAVGKSKGRQESGPEPDRDRTDEIAAIN